MRRTTRPSRRQAALFPKPVENGEAASMKSKREVVMALADLLLEALGERMKEGEADESEDHS